MSFRGPMTSANDREQVICACKKSYCLKLYCDCFRKRLLCNEWCSCQSCYNNGISEEKRKEAIVVALQKNQNAFRNTTSSGLRPVEEVGKGCNCLKSHCLKKYCECFQVKRLCDGRCRCLECKNHAGFFGMSAVSASKVLTSEGLSPRVVTYETSPLDELITITSVQQICASLLEAVQPLMSMRQESRESSSPIFKAFSDSLQRVLELAPNGSKRSSFDSENRSENRSHKKQRGVFL